MKLTDENANRLRQCVFMLFELGADDGWPSKRISNEVAEQMLVIMEPEVKRIAKVLKEVERSGWTT